MAIYTFKGLDRTGKEVKSTVNSDSLASAKHKIKSMGIMLLDIKEQSSASLKKSNASFSFGAPISIQDLSLMTRQFATLIKARIQIVEALTALMDQTDNPKMRVILSEVRQKVNEGSSLAAALSGYPKVFNNVYINMVEAGEASGTLHIVLVRLADFTEAQLKLKNRIKGAMIYPVIMIVVSGIMMGIIFAVVIPKITKIFINMKRELPLMTRISIFISDMVRNYWWAVILGIFAFWYFFKKYINTVDGRKRWDLFVLKVPKLGTLATKINVARFCSTLATLLTSGVPILASLKIVKNLIGNVHMQAAVQAAQENIAEGASMAVPLERSGLFPSMVTHMIKLGEKSGEIEPMLEIIAENYEDQVETELTGLTATLEPIMIVGMGIAVAFIVFSVVVPMMELNKMR